jgi:hypothetical protein
MRRLYRLPQVIPDASRSTTAPASPRPAPSARSARPEAVAPPTTPVLDLVTPDLSLNPTPAVGASPLPPALGDEPSGIMGVVQAAAGEGGEGAEAECPEVEEGGVPDELSPEELEQRMNQDEGGAAAGPLLAAAVAVRAVSLRTGASARSGASRVSASSAAARAEIAALAAPAPPSRPLSGQ